MPQIFKIGSYYIFFWSNENEPLEPVHVHVSKGNLNSNATKIWITKSGRCLICNNNSKIPKHNLNFIIKTIEARHEEIIEEWYKHFGEIRYYC